MSDIQKKVKIVFCGNIQKKKLKYYTFLHPDYIWLHKTVIFEGHTLTFYNVE